ncbi:MinD/ParA family protein [Nocardioides sp. DS6]|uniref:MinD/ParA family protein n=1 Tax=Nocardioides eburneus TaxID=3231482 RepID=A0ABV3T0E7_9ACTN
MTQTPGAAGQHDPLTAPLDEAGEPIVSPPASHADHEYAGPPAPPVAPPPGPPPTSQVAPPPVPPAPPTRQPEPGWGQKPPEEHTHPNGVPVLAPPPAQTPSSAVSPAPPLEDASFQAGQPEGDVRRFMTATDFLERRADSVGHGPATWGWRGAVRRMSGGLIKPAMGRKELAYEQDRAAIQRDFDGPRTIVFINPKGGAAKTTGVLAAGYTFGTVRGGGVVAWDNNETRGTLGIRGTRSNHRNTTRELLDDLGRFSDVYQSRIGDLGAFVRSQGDAHFDVLASDERPDVTGQIHADDFTAVHQLLERFYRIILVDTGNNMRAENWLAAAEAADLLVVTSTVREDTGYSGLWMLDALQESGYANLKYKTVTVLSDPSPKVDDKLAQDLVDVYQQRTRGVHRVPFDPILVGGSSVQYAQLSRDTRMSWLKACAGMAQAL